LSELTKHNQEFYDSVWRGARVRAPEHANTWAKVRALMEGVDGLLEIGPGVRPRLPLARARFLDASDVAVEKLRQSGAEVTAGDISEIPFESESFDFVCALDVIEHADDPPAALREVRRVLKPGGRLLFSVPMFADRWTEFDELVGHKQRFDPEDLANLLEELGLEVVESARFSSLPRLRVFLRIGTWTLRRFRRAAIWIEDRLVQPVQRRFTRDLEWQSGFVVPERVDGLILHCRAGSGNSLK